MNRLISLALILALIFLACNSAVPVHKYVGSVNSDKYHYPTCRWAKKISARNLITFETKEQAEKAGYVPCKVCKPK